MNNDKTDKKIDQSKINFGYPSQGEGDYENKGVTCGERWHTGKDDD